MEAMEEEEREDSVKPLLEEYGAVLDLLKNLPDAVPLSAQIPMINKHKGQRGTTQEKTPMLPRSSVCRKSSTVGELDKEEVIEFEENQRLSTRSRDRKTSLEYSTIC